MSEDMGEDMCPNCLTPWKCNGPHGWPSCDICGDESVMDDGVIGAYICDKNSCFEEAWDRAWR